MRLLAVAATLVALAVIPAARADTPATSTQSEGRPVGESACAAGMTARATRVAATASDRIPLMEAWVPLSRD